jgi:hypothetical protein
VKLFVIAAAGGRKLSRPNIFQLKKTGQFFLRWPTFKCKFFRLKGSTIGKHHFSAVLRSEDVAFLSLRSFSPTFFSRPYSYYYFVEALNLNAPE